MLVDKYWNGQFQPYVLEETFNIKWTDKHNENNEQTYCRLEVSESESDAHIHFICQ